MKIFKVVILSVAIIFMASLMGCSDKNSYEGMTKVIFELEGGTYQNCTLPVINYYGIDDGATSRIYELGELTSKAVERSGYILYGWYKTKETVDGNVIYSDEWNFDEDVIGAEGITLYAYWKKAVQHTYNVCYKDENNEVVILQSYDVIEDVNNPNWRKFDDYLNYASKRYNYTAIGYEDENGMPWDENFEHPLGDESLAINVYVKYIEGEYAIVRDAKELKSSKNKNIYLMADIDLGGEAFSFGDYKKDFQGNNFTISNFKVNYDNKQSGLVPDFEQEGKNSLCISIFGSLDGANIENVKFENVSVIVDTKYSKTFKIYVTPLCMKVTNSSISNVSFSGSFTYVNLPEGFNIEENLIFVTDKLYYLIDEKSIVENVECDVEVK